jgi:hypothetical protein
VLGGATFGKTHAPGYCLIVPLRDFRKLAFEGLEEIDKIANLSRVETKFWHIGMPRHDSFCQCLSKPLDRNACPTPW